MQRNSGVRKTPANNDWADLLGPIPDLPLPGQRWTPRSKAALIEAVRGGWFPIEEARRLYNFSVNQFLAWERDIDHSGVPGLRSTLYQIYCHTEARKA